MNTKTCIVIVGPTAVGKTAAAIELAKAFQTEIISADSRQCFRELEIGVAKPSQVQLEAVKHYFINSHSIHDNVNAGVFEEYALTAVTDIFSRHNVAVMVGGTGLYIDAFCQGLDEMPVISPKIREAVKSGYEQNGRGWLQHLIKENDPAFFSEGETMNPQRLMRALEVVLSTGRSIRSFHTSGKKNRDFTIIKAGLQLPREVLYANINNRVDDMIKAGLQEEASALLPYTSLNALNTVGYKEMFACLNGQSSLGEAVVAIKKNTRHYAKRQITWFTKDQSIKWFHPADHAALRTYLENNWH